MHQSEHDKIAEKIRREEMEKLIEQYTLEAAAASEEFGFLNVRGHEVPDPTVMEPPLGHIQQPDLMEMMRRMVRNTISDVAAQAEFETFEEADDFEIDDDPVDYASPYEMYFDPAPGSPAGPPGDATRRDPNEEPKPEPVASEKPKEGEILPPQ